MAMIEENCIYEYISKFWYFLNKMEGVDATSLDEDFVPTLLSGTCWLFDNLVDTLRNQAKTLT